MKKYYAVTSSYFDNGRISVAITDVIEANEQPQNEYHETKRCDVYIDYFESRLEAEAHVQLTKKA